MIWNVYSCVLYRKGGTQIAVFDGTEEKKKKGISGLTWWKQVISLSKETQGSKGKKKKKKNW